MALVDTLEPDTRERALALLDLAHAEGIELAVTSGRRTCEEQEAIYAKVPRVTHARGCRSWHTFGRAFDVLAKDAAGEIIANGYDPVYDRLGDLGKSIGLKWGGDFEWGRDAGHFEYHPGVTTEQACPDPTQCELYVGSYPSGSENGAKQQKVASATGAFLPWAVAGAVLGAVIRLASSRTRAPLIANADEYAGAQEGTSYEDRLVKHYGKTEDPVKGGFLLRDGSFLDLSEGSGSRSQDHRNVTWASTVPEKPMESRFDVMVRIAKRAGMYRWMPESWALQAWTPPSPMQLGVVSELSRFRPLILDLSGPRKKHFYREYEPWDARRAAADMRDFYGKNA